MTSRAPAAGASTLMRSSAVMAAGTLMSRVLGMLRAVLLVAAIGTGPSGDAFSIANTVPNAIYILLAGGVLNAVLVPQITRAAQDPDGGEEYVQRLLTVATALLAVATVLVTLAAPLLVRLYATDRWSDQQFTLATAFAFWCLPQVFWYGFYTLLGQVLNARGSFGPYMWAPVVNNVVAIGGLAVFMVVAGRENRPVDAWTPGMIALLAGTATLGVACQALILLLWTRRLGLSLRPVWGLRGFGLRTASRVAGWTFAAVAVSQLGYVGISKATTAGGSLSVGSGAEATPGKAVYDNSFLIFMLPHSLVAVSLVTALFTGISLAAASDRTDQVRQQLSLGLRLVGLATVLSTLGFLALGRDLTAAMFVGSDRAETDAIAYVTMGMIAGLVPFSAQYLFQRVFYAYEDARTPFLIQVPVVAIWSLGNLLSALFLPGYWVVFGVGLSMSVANLFGAAASAVVLRRRIGGFDGSRVLRTHVRLLLAGTVGAVAAWVTARGVHLVAGDGLLASLLATLLGGAVMVGLYVVLLRALRVEELGEALDPLIGRLRARGPRAL